MRTGKEAIRAQVQREREAEQKALRQAEHYRSNPAEVKLEAAQVISAAGGVFFTCDLIPGVMLTKTEMDGTLIESHCLL